MAHRKPLSTTQTIAIWGIIVPAVISSATAIIQNRKVDRSIAPVIQMKPQIVNVINNVTKVEKEIANLSEVLRQQYNLWKSETFRKSDLDIRVKKINRPVTSITTTASSILFELAAIPLENSIIVSSERGVISPNTLEVHKNIVSAKYLGSIDRELDTDTDFFNVRYIPDPENGDKLFTIKGMSYQYEGCEVDKACSGLVFHFRNREDDVEGP